MRANRRRGAGPVSYAVAGLNTRGTEVRRLPYADADEGLIHCRRRGNAAHAGREWGA